MTAEQQVRPLTAEEQFRMLFKRTAQLCDRVSDLEVQVRAGIVSGPRVAGPVDVAAAMTGDTPDDDQLAPCRGCGEPWHKRHECDARTTPDNPPTSTDTPDNEPPIHAWDAQVITGHRDHACLATTAPDGTDSEVRVDWDDARLLRDALTELLADWAPSDPTAAPRTYDDLEATIRTVERVRDGVIRHRDQLAAAVERARAYAHELRHKDAMGLLAALDGTEQPSSDGDTCRPVEVDGETIRVHGSRDLTEEEHGYFGEVIRAAKRKFAAEPPVVPADTGRESALTRRIRAQQRGVAEPEPHTGLVVQPCRTDDGRDAWVFRCWGTDTCDGWLSLDHGSQDSADRARDRHVAEEHGVEPGPTEAQTTCTATLSHPDDGFIHCDQDHGDWRIPTLHCGPIPGAESPAANRRAWRDTDPGATPHTDTPEADHA